MGFVEGEKAKPEATEAPAFTGFTSDQMPDELKVGYEEPEAAPERQPTKYQRSEADIEFERNAEAYLREQGYQPLDEPQERYLDPNSESELLRETEGAVEAERIQEELSAELIERFPAVESEQFLEDVAPIILEDLEARHGPAIASDAQVLGSLYLQMGGDEVYASAHEEAQIVSDILSASS